MVDELEVAASVLLAILFGHIVGAQNISWAAFSGYMVMRGHVSQTLWRGLLRIAGTGLGAGLALWLTPIVRTSPALSAVALALVGGVSLYGMLTRRHAYAWLFVGLTFAMILLDQLEHPAEPLMAFAATRAREVTAGTAACVLVSLLSTWSLRRRWPGQPQPPAQRHGWHPAAARHAGQAALAIALLPFIGQAWRVPELAQAAVTVMAVMIVPVTSIGGIAPVRRRILLRLAGAASGALLAAAVLLLAHSPWLSAAQAPVLIAGTVLGTAIGRHIENGQGALAYGGTQFVLVILTALVPDSYADADLGPGLARLVGIAVGTLLLLPVLLTWRLAAPQRAKAVEGGPTESGGI
jgi:uncharacterized membrane protein YccC